MIRTLLASLFNRKKSWNYIDLYYRLSRWGSSQSLPGAAEYPDQIYLTSDFWSHAKGLHELTLQDEHERAVSVWWIDGDICVTPEQRGERGSVTTNYNLQIKYDPHNYDSYISKEVSVNGQIILNKNVTEAEIPQKSVIEMLFHLHTHPPHYEEFGGKRHRIYCFFSATDIRSLIDSSSIVNGVITDEVIILCKTYLTPKQAPEMADEIITAEYLQRELGLVIYKGSWTTGVFSKIIIKSDDTTI